MLLIVLLYFSTDLFTYLSYFVAMLLGLCEC